MVQIEQTLNTVHQWRTGHGYNPKTLLTNGEQGFRQLRLIILQAVRLVNEQVRRIGLSDLHQGR